MLLLHTPIFAAFGNTAAAMVAVEATAQPVALHPGT
jgi:hypothetical protein